MDDSLLGSGEKKKEPCCLFKYNFSIWSRVLAAISVILLIIVSIVTLSQGLESSLFGFLTTGVVVLIELPFCCKCCCSETTVERLKFLDASKENPKGCLIRAVLYILFCMAGSAICVEVNHNDIILLLIFILLGVDGLVYFLAFFQGFSSGSTNANLAAAAKKAAAKRAVDYARENPDKMEDFAEGAATYAINNPDAASTFARGALGGDNDVGSSSASAWDNADDSWGGH